MVLTCLLLSSPFPIPSSQLHTCPQWPQPRLYCRELKHRQEPQAHLPVCSLRLASWGSLCQPTGLLDSPGPRATCMLSLYGSYRSYLLRHLTLGAGLLPPLCAQEILEKSNEPQPQAASQFPQPQPGPAALTGACPSPSHPNSSQAWRRPADA